MSRAGHHGDVVYVFENNGFNSSPSDTDFKTFGGSVTMDTYEGSHEAARVLNADRYADEIVEQVFDGAWSITCDGFPEPPWWIAGIFGQPNSTLVSGSLYDYDYNLTDSNDPTSLRLYAPTDGFNDYEMLGGCVIASVSVDQSVPNQPEISISGAYAQEPQTNSSLSPSPTDFAESSFTNREAEIQHDGTAVARSQTATLNIEANTELINEIGSSNAVDFSPKAFNPSLTFDKIVDTGQTKDPLSIFRTFNSVTTKLNFDNGLSGNSSYIVNFDVTGSVPDQWTESGRNDPEADLLEELDMMGETMTATITTTDGGGTVPGL